MCHVNIDLQLVYDEGENVQLFCIVEWETELKLR